MLRFNFLPTLIPHWPNCHFHMGSTWMTYVGPMSPDVGGPRWTNVGPRRNVIWRGYSRRQTLFLSSCHRLDDGKKLMLNCICIWAVESMARFTIHESYIEGATVKPWPIHHPILVPFTCLPTHRHVRKRRKRSIDKAAQHDQGKYGHHAQTRSGHRLLAVQPGRLPRHDDQQARETVHVREIATELSLEREVHSEASVFPCRSIQAHSIPILITKYLIHILIHILIHRM